MLPDALPEGLGPIGAPGTHRPLSDRPDDCRSYYLRWGSVEKVISFLNYVAILFICSPACSNSLHRGWRSFWDRPEVVLEYLDIIFGSMLGLRLGCFGGVNR